MKPSHSLSDLHPAESHAQDAVRASLLEHMDPARLAAVTEALETDDAADLLQGLSETLAERVLRSMHKQNRGSPRYYLTPKTRPSIGGKHPRRIGRADHDRRCGGRDPRARRAGFS